MKQIERHRGTVVILAALAAALVADGLIVGFLIKPPPLGWVGFAIVAALVLGLGMLAPLAFEHARQRAAARRGDHPAEDASCDRRPKLRRERSLRHDPRTLDDAVVHVVVPLRVSRLHFVTDDEDRERCEARKSMLRTVALLQQRPRSPARSAATSRSSR